MKKRLEDISEEEHSLLLCRLNSLPSGDRIQQLESELKNGLAKYQQLLGELEDTVRGYVKTARKIKAIGPDQKQCREAENNE